MSSDALIALVEQVVVDALIVVSVLALVIENGSDDEQSELHLVIILISDITDIALFAGTKAGDLAVISNSFDRYERKNEDNRIEINKEIPID